VSPGAAVQEAPRPPSAEALSLKPFSMRTLKASDSIFTNKRRGGLLVAKRGPVDLCYSDPQVLAFSPCWHRVDWRSLPRCPASS
jgi:hypothetical protein